VTGSVLQLVADAGWITKGVLAVLIGFSVATWAIIFFKWRTFRGVLSDNAAFVAAYQQHDALDALARVPHLPLDRGLGFVFSDGMDKVRRHGEGSATGDWLASLERRLRGTIREEVNNQERYLGVLATTANVAPFIGLFGTVWGIISAFQDIAAQGSASIAAVAPGVAEALVATAAGLFAAIPAVVGYNYFINQVRAQAALMETFAVEFVDLVYEAKRARS
jgi:biopolymer transport protein TolQ